MTPSEMAELMNRPTRPAHTTMLEHYPDAWHYRMLSIDFEPGMPWWQRLLRRRRVAYWITMHDHSHKLVILPGVTGWLDPAALGSKRA